MEQTCKEMRRHERTVHAVMVPLALIPAAVWERLLAPAAALILCKHAGITGAIIIARSPLPAICMLSEV